MRGVYVGSIGNRKFCGDARFFPPWILVATGSCEQLRSHSSRGLHRESITMARRSPMSQRSPRPSSSPAKRKGVPLSPLAEQMLHDMQLAGLSERTHEAYLRAVRKFAQWL